MERECCLSMLIALICGTTLLVCGWWPVARIRGSGAWNLERITWRRVWLPVVPAVAVAAWLCGWALVEPDPMPERVPNSLILTSLLFALVLARAAVRAGWSLIGDRGGPGTATVGLLRPWILFSPHLAKRLDDRQIEAALEHERAHARHRDPVRIRLTQLATDLQWPWPQARARFGQWLHTLEFARDDEARRRGVEGTDLAAAILAAVRLYSRPARGTQVTLAGDLSVLEERISRLLGPPPQNVDQPDCERLPSRAILAFGLLFLLMLGSMFGEQTVRAILWIAS